MQYRRDIVQLHERGWPEREIARHFERAPSVIHYWIARQGRQRQKTKSGRPRVTSSVEDDNLFHTSQENPFYTAVRLKQELVPHCSVETVRRRLKERGLKCRIPARKPLLTAEHREKRLSFALRHLAYNVEEWHRVVFSDEKVFRSFSGGPRYVYRPLQNGSNRYDEKYIAPSTNPNSRHTVCVWMAFGGNGAVRQLHLIERKTLNSDYYIERILPLIENTVVERDLIFMQDLSSIHTSERTYHWLRQHNITTLSDWPPKGPDMNPVENVWAELVRRIPDASNNRAELWDNVLKAFHDLDDEYFTKLIESMPRRVAEVVDKRGGWTKY